MGRRIKHVPLDFAWPIGQIWEGYLNPFYQYQRDCPFCGGSGYNAATKQLSDDWYDFAGTGRKWCYQLTQDEVDALVEGGRLHDLTRVFEPGKGWGPVIHHPTADEVNEWAQRPGLIGHDSVNHWICLETRAKRLGIWGNCEHCHGKGAMWLTPGLGQRAERWGRQEPPTGDGWQVWETVTEGSPVSPVFASADALIAWLIGQGYSPEAARQFCKVEWTPSFIGIPGQGLLRDIESCAVTGGAE